jgi:hypothetical protein
VLVYHHVTAKDYGETEYASGSSIGG